MELYGGDDLSFAHQVPLQLPVASNDRRWRRWLHGWRARSCALAFMRLWASHTFWPLRLLSTIGRRICCNYELDDGGSEARWCAGEVIVSRPLRCAVTSPSTVKPRVTERKRGNRGFTFLPPALRAAELLWLLGARPSGRGPPFSCSEAGRACVNRKGSSGGGSWRARPAPSGRPRERARTVCHAKEATRAAGA